MTQKTYIYTKICKNMQMFTEALFLKTKSGNNLNVHQLINKPSNTHLPMDIWQ